MIFQSNWPNHYHLRMSAFPLMNGKEILKSVLQVKFLGYMYYFHVYLFIRFITCMLYAHTCVYVCACRGQGSALGVFFYHSPLCVLGVGSFIEP